MSLDGFVAGPDQSLEHPLGVGGEALHEWAFATRAFRETHGDDGGERGLDDEHAASWRPDVGATIMGRNMFGPVRGAGATRAGTAGGATTRPTTPLSSSSPTMRGASVEMDGGTTFHFVTDGIESALERAVAAAREQDVMIAGGASTAQQYLRAGLVDELEIHVVPALLGRGERLFDDLADASAGFECIELVSSPAVAHYRYVRRPAS